jgi:hypothetical protein
MATLMKHCAVIKCQLYSLGRWCRKHRGRARRLIRRMPPVVGPRIAHIRKWLKENPRKVKPRTWRR